MTQSKSQIAELREEKNMQILDSAKEACAKLGGFAAIDERYVVVDTKHFKVIQKSGD